MKETKFAFRKEYLSAFRGKTAETCGIVFERREDRPRCRCDEVEAEVAKTRRGNWSVINCKLFTIEDCNVRNDITNNAIAVFLSIFFLLSSRQTSKGFFVFRMNGIRIMHSLGEDSPNAKRKYRSRSCKSFAASAVPCVRTQLLPRSALAANKWMKMFFYANTKRKIKWITGVGCDRRMNSISERFMHIAIERVRARANPLHTRTMHNQIINYVNRNSFVCVE